MKKVTIKEFDEYIEFHKLPFEYRGKGKIYFIPHKGIDNTLPAARVLEFESYDGNPDNVWYEFYINDNT